LVHLKELKMNRFLFFFLLYVFNVGYGQQNRGDVRIMFYNLQNLFDTENDSLKNDDEFTPLGDRKWTEYRYDIKVKNIFKVISKAGGWYPPEIITFCEIENKKVLKDLIDKTPLYKFQYEIVHYESPDARGIDVGCIYNTDKLTYVNSFPIPVIDLSNKEYKTRDILYVNFKTENDGILHVFINHWPSRRGGELQSARKRQLAAQTLINTMDTLFNVSPENVIILGDFNDTPNDKSMAGLVGRPSNNNLINISHCRGTNCGTIKYNGIWQLFDQAIVSKSFIGSKKGLFTNTENYRILDFDFLLIADNAFSGKKPFPTYLGPRYLGGFSDHLPFIVDIWFVDK